MTDRRTESPWPVVAGPACHLAAGLLGGMVPALLLGVLSGGALAWTLLGSGFGAGLALAGLVHTAAVFALAGAILGLVVGAPPFLAALVRGSRRAFPRVTALAAALLVGLGLARSWADVLREAAGTAAVAVVVVVLGTALAGGWLAGRFAGRLRRPAVLTLVASVLVVCAAWIVVDHPLRGDARSLGTGTAPGVPLPSPSSDRAAVPARHTQAEPSWRAPRNVVLVVIDTLRADRLSCYGYPRPTTPSIDRLASDGALFRNASAQKTVTSPSVATLISGTYPRTHGLVGCNTRLPDAVVTLAEILSAAGFRTGAAVANSNVGASFNFDQGYDVLHRISGRRNRVAAKLNEFGRVLLDGFGGEPFFLYMHYMDPHAPYRPGGPYRDAFRGTYTEDGPAERLPIGDGWMGMLHHKVVIDDGERDPRVYRERYDEEILGVDDGVGALLAELRARGLEDETLVVLTSDHGESLGDHGYYFAHGSFAYQATAHVPLVMRLPGVIAPGRDIDAVVELVDVLPTVLELLGLPPGSGVEGTSLVPLLLGTGAAGNDEAITEGGYGAGRLITTLRAGRWKLIHNPKGIAPATDLFRPEILLPPRRLVRLREVIGGGHPPWMGRWELYDLQNDPDETRNLVSEEPERFAAMRGRLFEWMATGPSAWEPELRAEDLDPELAQELEALGYLDH